MATTFFTAPCVRLRQSARCERGSINILAAVSLGTVIAAAALAVDLGSIYLERRAAQGAVDLAAMAAANDIDNAEAAARATLAANKVAGALQLTVTKGHYTANAAVAADRRFAADAMPYNAVRVSLTKPARLYFAKTFAPSSKIIGVGATAATADQAVFSIGSRLASVSDGLPNAMLGALLGGHVDLAVADYRALADASITMQGFLDHLASELSVTAGTYDELLATNATAGDVLNATANAATAAGESSAAGAALELFDHSAAASKALNLNSLVDLGQLGNVAVGEKHAGLAGKLNVMSLISAAAVLANGRHQVALSLAGEVPGLLDLQASLSVGEPQQASSWVAVGEVGSELHTAQIRLRLIAEVGGQGALSALRIRLPIYLDVAGGHARLADVACDANGGGSARATVAARPSLLRAWIGEIDASDLATFPDDLDVGAGRIVQAPLVTVSGRASVAMSNLSDTELDFTQADVDAQTVQTVETHDLVQSLVASLLGELDLTVQIGGLGLGLGSQSVVAQAVRTTLQTIAAPLDAALASLLTTLGVHVGEADIQVHGIRCGTAILAG